MVAKRICNRARLLLEGFQECLKITDLCILADRLQKRLSVWMHSTYSASPGAIRVDAEQRTSGILKKHDKKSS